MADEKKETTTATPTWVRTLTLSETGADGKDAIRQNKSVFMARFIGVINEVTAKEAKGRAFEICYGEFRAINANGDQFESDKLIFPGSTGDTIMAAAKIENAKGLSLEFAIDVFSNPDAPGKKSPLGYGYVGKNLIESRAKSALNDLAAKLAPATGDAPKHDTAKGGARK